ncbi:MAG: uroporphyrinogen-III synthase [Gammaproteobacteria bacterium]|nr:uroporphyrinogen-III synthase [Gammaproteobacteria bacterium]
MKQPLHGKRILVTRPEHQATHWQCLLVAAGALVDSIPMLAIVPIERSTAMGTQKIKNLILEFDRFDHGIFVSQNAVRYGFDWLDDFWPQLPQGPQMYAIGKATARAVEKRGAQPVVNGITMDSEALLTLPQLQALTGQRIIIFRGFGGRSLIGDTLRARGAKVDYCELYERQLPPAATAQLAQYFPTPDAITVHSGETLKNLTLCITRCKRQALLQTPLVCPSQRVMEEAQAAGFKVIVTAANATDTAMLEALQKAVVAADGSK